MTGCGSMAIRDVFKVTRKTFFNPTQWIDLEALIDQNKVLKDYLFSLFSRPTPVRQETFKEAATRLKLTQEDIAKRIRNFDLFCYFFVLLSLASFAFSWFLLFAYAAFADWVLGLAVTAFLVANAYQFSFWAAQLKKRKLGLTFKEWKQFILGSEKGSST